MNDVAVPRWHAGQAFRSSLEADWAATLDHMHIKWVYEPQLFTLPSGERYLPDFFLPEIGTWLEVKGDGVPRIEKAYEFGRLIVCSCAGVCYCRWQGGLQLVVGLKSIASRSGEEMRFGAMAWTSSRATAWLTKCFGCCGWFWIQPAFSWCCRRCGALWPNKSHVVHLYSPGELQFCRASRSEGTAITDLSILGNPRHPYAIHMARLEEFFASFDEGGGAA